MKYSRELVLSMYQTMINIRNFETTASNLFYQGKIPGSMHVYLGEEAGAAGIFAALRADDFAITTHRGHGHVLAKGADMKLMMAELFGKEAGYCKGKGGSMHIAVPSIGMLGANGIVGAGLPIALGPALYAQYKKTNQVSVCLFGDGASNQGTFHESLNLASTWKLPVVYICENNQYGMTVSRKRHQAVEMISSRAVGYNMPGVTVDGNDPFAVYEAVKEAAERARRGEGPTLIETLTYLHHEHGEGMKEGYRPKEEIEEWMKNDPISCMEKYILDNGYGDKALIQEYKDRSVEMVKEAVAFAERASIPKPEAALEDIYTDLVAEGRNRA